MLALHGLDVVGLEISKKGAETARAYIQAELADPHDYNFGNADSKSCGSIGEVQVISGDFFKRDWEEGTMAGEGFDIIYDYTVSGRARHMAGNPLNACSKVFTNLRISSASSFVLCSQA